MSNYLNDERGNELLERSDGGTLLYLGSCVAVASGVAILAALINTDIRLLVVSGAMLGVAIALLAWGSVVRAIYFLPGDQIKPKAETATARAKDRLKADFYHASNEPQDDET